ncbi:MAG: response regulator transcription factor [Candidatus Cloacimonetes bacterium]|jgi:two-component system invasion response regulator UvrY|nr:response regulator transcription factor [Candidatus Cloacimonadota bacterium]
MIRILVADDHPIVRKGIVQVLKHISKTFLMDEVDNARDAILKASKNDYEIIMLDISMPKGGGLDALDQIMKIKPHSKILMLSVYDNKQYIIRALKNGACGYLTKTSAADELEDAIKKVRSGGKFLSSAVAEKIAYMLEDNIEQPKHENLTNREFQVFCLLAEGKATGDIAKELCLSTKTVTTYRSRILDKLQLKTNYDLIKYAHKHNLTEKFSK